MDFWFLFLNHCNRGHPFLTEPAAASGKVLPSRLTGTSLISLCSLHTQPERGADTSQLPPSTLESAGLPVCPSASFPRLCPPWNTIDEHSVHVHTLFFLECPPHPPLVGLPAFPAFPGWRVLPAQGTRRANTGKGPS